MKGMDIIEAMGAIDADLILDARQVRRKAPRALKWASIAACLVCAVSVGFLLMSRLSGPSRTPGPLATGAVPASPGLSPTPSPSPSPSPSLSPLPEQPPDLDGAIPQGMALLTSPRWGVSLLLQEEYAADVLIDEDYTPEDFYDVDPEDFRSMVFQLTFPLPGSDTADELVLAIRAATEEDLGPIRERLPDFTYYNLVRLGDLDGTVYELFFPAFTFQGLTDPDALRSYEARIEAGRDAMADFITRNGLSSDGSWEAIFDDYLRFLRQEPEMEFSTEEAAPEWEDILCTIPSQDGVHEIRVWQLYRVPMSDFSRWDNEALMELLDANITPDFLWDQWAETPLFGAIYEVGRDSRAIYLLDLTTEIVEILESSQDYCAYLEERAHCPEAVSDTLAAIGAEENPYWRDVYESALAADAITDGYTVPYGTVLDMELPRFKVTTPGEDYLLRAIDPYTLSRSLPEILGVGWTLSRAAMNADVLEENGISPSLIVGYDGSYTYYLTVPPEPQYLSDPVSQANYYNMMAAGKRTIRRLLEMNDIVEAENWEALYDALWSPEQFEENDEIARWIYPSG